MKEIVAPEDGDKVLRADGTTWEVYRTDDEEPVFDYGNEEWQVNLLLNTGDPEADEEEDEVSIEWDFKNSRWKEVE